MPPEPSPAAPAKPLRADARRNREKIVEAAKEAFAELGLDAQMDDVAKRAGVGVGTLYRHFPTKDALVRALIENKMGRMAERGRALLAEGRSDDAWAVFSGFARACAQDSIADRGLAQVTSTQRADSFADAAREAGLVEVVAEMISAARAEGSIRDDACVQDFPLMMCGLGAIMQTFGEGFAERYIGLVLDGVRNVGAEPLPPAPDLPFGRA